jgi:hypothetical protein
MHENMNRFRLNAIRFTVDGEISIATSTPGSSPPPPPPF